MSTKFTPEPLNPEDEAARAGADARQAIVRARRIVKESRALLLKPAAVATSAPDEPPADDERGEQPVARMPPASAN